MPGKTTTSSAGAMTSARSACNVFEKPAEESREGWRGRARDGAGTRCNSPERSAAHRSRASPPNPSSLAQNCQRLRDDVTGRFSKRRTFDRHQHRATAPPLRRGGAASSPRTTRQEPLHLARSGSNRIGRRTRDACTVVVCAVDRYRVVDAELAGIGSVMERGVRQHPVRPGRRAAARPHRTVRLESELHGSVAADECLGTRRGAGRTAGAAQRRSVGGRARPRGSMAVRVTRTRPAGRMSAARIS